MPVTLGLKPWAFWRKSESRGSHRVAGEVPQTQREARAQEKYPQGRGESNRSPQTSGLRAVRFHFLSTGVLSAPPPASHPNKPAAISPSTPSSRTGARQLPALATRHPAYNGPARSRYLAPIPTSPSARPLASGKSRAISAVADG